MLPRSSLFSPYNFSLWLVGRGSKHLLERPSVPPVLVVIMLINKNKEIWALMDESFPAAAAVTVRRTGGAGGDSGVSSGGDSGVGSGGGSNGGSGGSSGCDSGGSGSEKDFEQVRI